MAKYDLVEVKQAAAGRWSEILGSLGGISADLLDGNHHPCPKCGGTDRFRVLDDFATTGAVLCNQCFNKKNGDGLAAIQWLNGQTFGAVLNDVANHLGMKPAKKEKSIDDGLEWRRWNSDLIANYLRQKVGIHEHALLLAGAKLAMYRKRDPVIVLPVVGPALDTAAPVNYVLQSAMGAKLVVKRKDGSEEGVAKKVVAKGKGLIGHGIDLLRDGKAERVWKVEGVTDLLALLSVMTGDELNTTAVVTSASGATEKPAWMGDVLAGYDTLICHDLDRAGEAGAAMWAREISLKRDAGATIVRLPGEVSADHGADLRDWLNQGNSYAALLKLAEAGDKIVAKRTDSGDLVADEASDLVMERAICRDLQIEVLGELENGHARVFSLFHRKTVDIPDVGRISYEKLLQICGSPAKAKVHTGPDEVEGAYRLRDVKEAIGAIAGYRQISDHDTVGHGVWAGRHLDDSETGSVVLVNVGNASRYNGDKVLRKVLAPRVDGLLLDMNGDKPWFDHDLLAANLEAIKTDPKAFGSAAVRDCEEIISRWRWRTAASPTIVTGCILASFIQTILRWRPQVSISGESNAGKSFLFECLGGPDDQSESGLFLKLAFKSSKSSEAGIRQTVQYSAVVVMCDEFEGSKERDKILELIRTSSRASNMTRGSASQKATRTSLRHICWVAAIETGLNRQADQNRFISLELLPAKPGEHGKLRLPTSAERWSLGHRLLAIAIYHALEARELASRLKDTKVEEIEARQVENYAVPAALLGLARQYSIGDCEKLLAMMADSNVDKSDQGESDQESLLADILLSPVFTGAKHGNLTVGQILDDYEHYGNYAHLLESKGLKATSDQKLFIASSAGKMLLRGTQWEGVTIKKLLMRLPGADSRQQRFSASILRGVAVPVDAKMINGSSLVENEPAPQARYGMPPTQQVTLYD